MLLTKQSLSVQKELNARETLNAIKRDAVLTRNVKMRVDKVQREISDHSEQVSRIISEDNFSDTVDDADVKASVKPDAPQPSTSGDTSIAAFQPNEHDLSGDFESVRDRTSTASNVTAPGKESKQELIVSSEIKSDRPTSENSHGTSDVPSSFITWFK